MAEGLFPIRRDDKRRGEEYELRILNHLRALHRKVPLLPVVLVFSVFLLGGCGSSSDGPVPGPEGAGLVTLSGQVSNAVPAEVPVAATDRQGALKAARLLAGAGVADVEITATMDGWELARTSTPGEDGFYAFEVPVPSEESRLVLTFRRNGYITYQRALTVKAGESHSVHVVLPRVETPTVTDGVASGDAFRFENLPDGDFTLFVGDPTDPVGAAAFPGDYMAATAASGDVPLVSMAFFEATLASGDEAVTAFDPPINVTLLLPEGYQDGTLLNPDTGLAYVSGDVIDWWSYDTDLALWVEEDADPSTPERDKAVIVEGADGRLYVTAKATHFSWWNADYPQEFAYFCVQVVDGDGKALENVPVYSTGVSYKNTSRPVRTDENGWARGIVVKKSTSDAAEGRERAQVYALAGNVRFFYDVTEAAEGIVDSDDIYTPFDENECERSDGRPSIRLDNAITVSFEGVVEGTVKSETGAALAGIKVYSSTGGVAETDSSGRYSLNVPVNADVMIYVAGVEAKEAKVTDKDVPVTVDFSVANQAPVITRLVRTPEGQLGTLGSVTFSGEARDPEGGAVTYAWTATDGTFSTATGSSTVWTAPNSLSGSAQITFTATDGEGKSSSMTVPVAWGPLPLAGRLVVNLLDDEGDPVVGAWVILHKADGSVEATKKTNALGKADFGDIGRNTATVSYAYEQKKTYPGTLHTYRRIYTAVDIPVAELKILVEDDDDDEGEQSHLFAAEDDGDGPLYSVSLAVASPDIPEEGYVTFQPAYAYLYREYPRQDGVSVYPSHLQEDGKLTLLALARTWNEGSEAQTLHSWGVLYDQTPVSGDLYTVDLTGNPVNVPWTSNVDVTWLSLTAERRGVEYTLSDLYDYSVAGSGARRTAPDGNELRARKEALLAKAAKAGTAQIAAFEADAYAQSASGANVNDAEERDYTVVEEEKRLGSSLPSSMTVSLPDYLFTSASLDRSGATPQASWRLATTNAVDAFFVGLTGSKSVSEPSVYSYTTVNWNVIVDREKGDGNYTFPSLPAELAAWLADLDWGPTLSLSVVDYDNLSGFDSLMSLVLNGQDPNASALRVLNGNWPYGGEPR